MVPYSTLIVRWHDLNHAYPHSEWWEQDEGSPIFLDDNVVFERISLEALSLITRGFAPSHS